MQQLARALTIASVALFTIAPSLLAQSGMPDAEAKEIASYTLTMAAVNKFEAAMREFATEMKKDPRAQRQAKLEAEIDALHQKDERTDAEDQRLASLEQQLEAARDAIDFDIGKANTLGEMAEQAARIPPFAAALKRAGLTPREYAVFTLAFLQASMYAGMLKAGVIKELDIPREVNRAQIRFVRDHEAELAAFQERMKSESDQ